jgi:hypothetical protein
VEGIAVQVIDTWTGRHASALRIALRLTNERFADMLGASVRSVANWNAEPDLVPVSEWQRALDTVLAQASAEERDRFMHLLVDHGEPVVAPLSGDPAGTPFLASAELRLGHDPDVNEMLGWLDGHAHWKAGEARRRVSELVRRLDADVLTDAVRRRSRVPRHVVAEALADYYRIADTDYQLCESRLDGKSVTTSILSRPIWLDLRLPLAEGRDRLSLSSAPPTVRGANEHILDAAVRRIAETLATGTRLVNRPLYRLTGLEISPEQLDGTVALTEFGAYALTLDLLEHELLDALSANRHGERLLPLRDALLPSVQAAVDFRGRLCAGGPLALFAAARPASRRRPEPDYVLLVQERSSRVLNSARRLAVIPKSFHEPLVDFSDDAHISATLERELEEELFGRADLDTSQAERRVADPFSTDRLSAPMRWLLDRHASPETWRMECTAFGVNLVSGNFEFASLIAIHDEGWWREFGGHVEANWEAEGLRRYSSRDRDALADLIRDPAWSSEGLFAFTRGLRRLSELAPDRVRSPLD